MSIFFSIIIGVSIAVIAQFVMRFILEPWIERAKTIEVIDAQLIFYRNVYTNNGTEISEEASDEYRRLSCELKAKTRSIVLDGWLKHLPNFISREDAYEASKKLIFLSNSCNRRGAIDKNEEAVEKIRKLLRITEQ